MPLTHDIRVRIPYRLHEERRIRYPALFSYPRATHPGRKAPAREVFRPPPSPGPHCPVLEESPNGRHRTPLRARAPEGSPNGGTNTTPHRTRKVPERTPPDTASRPCPRKFPKRRHKHDSAPRTKSIRANNPDAASHSCPESSPNESTNTRLCATHKKHPGEQPGRRSALVPRKVPERTGPRLAPVPPKVPRTKAQTHDSAPRTKNIRANNPDAAPPSAAQSPEMQPTELRPKNRTAAG